MCSETVPITAFVHRHGPSGHFAIRDEDNHRKFVEHARWVVLAVCELRVSEGGRDHFRRSLAATGKGHHTIHAGVIGQVLERGGDTSRHLLSTWVDPTQMTQIQYRPAVDDTFVTVDGDPVNKADIVVMDGFSKTVWAWQPRWEGPVAQKEAA